MSRRLTNEWTETPAQAFGESGIKGDAFEEHAISLIERKGWRVSRHQSDKKMQIAGCDVTIHTPSSLFTADLKGNFKDGKFYVEVGRNGWLYNPQKTSTYIIHGNATSEVLYIYKRKDMQEYLDRNDIETFVMWGRRVCEFTVKMIEECGFVSEM